MNTIRTYLKPFVSRITFGVIIKFIGTMMDLILPWLLAYLIDDIMPTGDMRNIVLCGLSMVLFSVIAVTFNIRANRMAAGNSKDFTQALRHDLFTHISYLPAAQRDQYSIASMVSRLTNDTYNVHQLVDKMQRLGIRAPLLVLGGTIFAFTLEPYLALVLLCMIPLLSLIVFLVTKKGIPLYRHSQTRIDALVRIVRENALGVRVIKALSKSEQEAGRFDDANTIVCDAETKAGTVMAVTNPAMGLFLNMGFMLVILVGAFRVNLGLTQPGKIMAFLSYFTIILNAVLSITKIFVLWSKGSASAQRISEIMNLPVGNQEAEYDSIATDFHISCENVCFTYKSEAAVPASGASAGAQLGDSTLSDISFALKRGQTLGIIGPTGSGKTTLISLLLRFYDVDSGHIRINGDDIRGIPLQALRHKFGVAFQNDVLLQESIYENISFLRDIPREDVEKAARIAQIDTFIQSLPDAYDSMLDVRGANLSGGQKQRLLIARALAGNPEILVLDDSLSALDYRTDAALRKAIAAEYSQTTTIIISQRVSAIRHADLILLLENGRLEGAGSHDELIAHCETYQRISYIQMGGEPA